jgi:23S rRNA-/tRNA-specific pseudouridylate synthase
MNLESAEIPIDRQCQIVASHEAGIWAFDKAPGVLSHPNMERGSHRKKSLLKVDYDTKNEAYWWTDKRGKKREIFLLHRLDSPTSGIILGASTKQIANCIKSAFAKREIKKTYHAIVIPTGNQLRIGMWKDNLVEKRENGKIRVSRGDGPIAITKVHLERNRSGLYGLNLLKLIPQTGRTHQLRVQCALRRMPVLGDKSYGNFSLNRKYSRASKIDRLFLHATNISLSVEFEGAKIDFNAEAPLPRTFGKLLS